MFCEIVCCGSHELQPKAQDQDDRCEHVVHAGEHGVTAQAIGEALAQNLGLPAPKGLTWEEAEDVKWLPTWIR